MKLPFEELNIK